MLPSIPPDAIEAERAHRRASQIMQGATYWSAKTRRRKAIRALTREFDLSYQAARDLTRIVESDDHE